MTVGAPPVSRATRVTARTLFMLGLSLGCGYDWILSGLHAALGGGAPEAYGVWVGTASLITVAALIAGWSVLRTLAAVRQTLFWVWFGLTLVLTLYAVSIGQVSSDSATPAADTAVAWLSRYTLFFVPGLLFVGAAGSFGWMLACGRPAARPVRSGNGAVL